MRQHFPANGRNPTISFIKNQVTTNKQQIYEILFV